MTTKLIYLTIISSSFLLTACGGDADNKATENRAVLGASQSSTIMKEHLRYSMSRDETIVPISKEPQITIEMNIQTGQTTAELLSGQAKIIALN